MNPPSWRRAPRLGSRWPLAALATAAALVIGGTTAPSVSAATKAAPCRKPCTTPTTSSPTTTPTTTAPTTTTTPPTTTPPSTTTPADTARPTVAVAAPVSGATVTGTTTVSGTASDNAAVARVDVAVDGGAYQAAAGTSNWSLSWSTTGLSNGSHTLTARATDTSGNVATASTTVTVSNTTAPGTWVSPEGVTIEVNSAGGWTVPQVYNLLKASARDLDKIGPSLTVKVQDVYASATAASASQTDGRYVSFRATVYLKGVNSNFAYNPDAIMAHEYGHVWSQYHLYLSQQGNWSSYLQARGIAADSRLDSSYNWDRREIIGDDYRLLFGSASAVSQLPQHLNSELPDPRNVAGLRDFLAGPWSTPAG